MSANNLKEEINGNKPSIMFQFENLSERERVALFGEPSKNAKKLYRKFNPLSNENAQDDPFFMKKLKKISIDHLSDEPHEITFWEKVRKKLQACVISTNNSYKSAWDFFLLLIISYNCMIVSYYVCFEVIGYLRPLDIFIEVVYYIDIILNFFQAYKNPNSFREVTDIKEIAKHYIRTWFILDLISIIPFIYFMSNYAIAFSFKLVRTARLPRIYNILSVNQIEKVLEAFLINRSQRERYRILYATRNTYKLLALVVSAGILTYFLGCFWYLIVSNESSNPSDDNFYYNNDLNSETMPRRLIICCYFVMTTLSTVGYGDYTPLTTTEQVISIFIMIMGIALFSYIMGNFNNLGKSDNPNKTYEQQNNLQKWMTILTKFTDKSHLPKILVEKIDKHFEYFWQNDKLLELTPNDDILTRLPKPIRHEIMSYLFEEIFHTFRGFLLVKDHIGSPFYYEISFEFLPVKYEPFNVILESGSEVNEVYLIQVGEIEISFVYEELKIKRILKSGYHFGNYHIFSGNCAEFTYTAIKPIKALILPKHRFLKLLEKYPEIKKDMTNYAFKMAKQTHKAMADTLKTSLKREKGSEITFADAQKIIREIIEMNIGKKIDQIFKKQSCISEATDFEEVEKKLSLFGEQISFMSRKMENLRNFVFEHIKNLKENVEKMKQNSSSQQEKPPK